MIYSLAAVTKCNGIDFVFITVPNSFIKVQFGLRVPVFFFFFFYVFCFRQGTIITVHIVSITVYVFKNIKNWFYGTIHIFKNYFTTVFLISVKISCIQMNHKFIIFTHKMKFLSYFSLEML